MSKTKKILSIVLAAVMAFSVFSICAFADTDTATWTLSVTNTDGTAISGSISKNTEVLVTVKLQTNYYVGTTGIPVFYDKTAFSYVDSSAVLTEIFGTGATRTASSNNAAAFPTATTDVNSTDYGVFYASYVPNSGVTGVASPKYTTATTVLTFKLKAIADKANAKICLTNTAQKTSSNVGGNFYCGSRASSDVTTTEATVGQTFVVTGASQLVTVATASADPVLTGISTGVVDSTNNYVYGVPAGTTADATTAGFGTYFTVTNGTFEVSGNGTGATLTVKKTDGTTFATYTIVIFGDVNGDGAVTAADYVALKNSLGAAGVSGATKVAADVNGSGYASVPDATAADYVALKNALGSTGYTNVNPFAA